MVSKIAEAVLTRIKNGEIPTQHHITGSLVRGVRTGKEKAHFPNGDKIHPAVLESLTSADLIERYVAEKFGTWGYMSRTYAFYPKGQAPKEKGEETYVL